MIDEHLEQQLHEECVERIALRARIKELNKRIVELETICREQWHPYPDKKPDAKIAWYLVSAQGYVFIDCWMVDRWKDISPVSWWMEIPEPPEEEK